MKKITLAIASLCVISLFSSCVVIGADEDPYAVIHIETHESTKKSDKTVEDSDSDKSDKKSKKDNSDSEKDDTKSTEKTTDKTSEKTSEKAEEKPAETTKPAESTTPAETTTPAPAEQEPAKEVLYKVTAINRTSVPVIDWCVKKDNVMIFSSSANAHAIEPNGADAITDLKEGEYKIFFSFEGYGFGTDWTLYDAGDFTLDQNMTYIITERELSVYEEAYAECRNTVK